MPATQLDFQITVMNEDARERADQLTLLFENLDQTKEIENIELETLAPAPAGTRTVDPVLGAAILVSVGPALATKLIEFLHDWVISRERATLHVRIQTKKDHVIEVDMPASMKPAEIKRIIAEIQKITGN